jgi:thiamine-phosphate pyrophosphorylase
MESAVRALRETWATRDFRFVAEHATPDIVLDWSESVSPYRGVYRGLDEAQGFFRAMLEAFSETTWEPLRLTSIGDRLAVEGRFGIRGDSSGLETTARGGQLWSFDAGLVKSIKIFQSGVEAIRAMRRARLQEARLYFVCEALPGERDPSPLLDAALRGGVDIVQMREKGRATDERLVELAGPFRRAATEHGALFIINDRPDLVGACEADGAHVGQDDASVAKARRLAGGEALIGLSTHSPDQIEAACSAVADDRPDQVSVGPVFQTPTKAGRPATGLKLLELAARRLAIPWFAIGGIDASSIAEVAGAGATRVVVVRAIRDASDPEASAAVLRDALVDASPCPEALATKAESRG